MKVLHVITGMRKAASDGIPSKICRIFGQKKSLVVVTALGSGFAQFAESSGGGVVVNDAAELAKFIPTGFDDVMLYLFQLLGLCM